MAGHPPVIYEDKDSTFTVFSFNECPSVPFKSVKRAVSALKKAGFLPSDSELELEEGRIYICIPRPRTVPNNRRARAYIAWSQPLRQAVHVMNICIQSERAPHEVVRHIGSLALVA